MNIWALDKDLSIKHVLLLLSQEVGQDAFITVDTDILHHKSIRIGTTDCKATAYIYTYAQPEGRYGLHLEYLYNTELNTSEQENMYEGLDYEALLEILYVHFGWERKSPWQQGNQP